MARHTLALFLALVLTAPMALAQATPFGGTGCPGAPKPTIPASQVRLGRTVQHTVGTCAVGEFGFFLLGGNVLYELRPPLMCQQRCMLGVDIFGGPLWITIDPQRRRNYTFAIPNVPALVGLQLFGQTGCLSLRSACISWLDMMVLFRIQR